MEIKGFKVYRIVYNLALAFCLLSIGSSKLNSISIALLAIVTIVGALFKWISFKPNWVFSLLCLLYLYYVGAYFFSDNQVVAAKYLEYKAALFILPALFTFSAKNLLKLNLVFSGLILGVLIFGGIGLQHAYDCFQSTNLSSCFNSSSISTEIHPSYQAAFVLMAIVSLIIGNKQRWFIKQKWIVFLLVGILAVYSFLLLSLAGILFLALLFVIGTIYFAFCKLKWKGIGIVLVFLSVLVGLGLRYTPTKIKSELVGPVVVLKEAINHQKNYIETRKYPISGSETRLMMWMMSVELLKKHPFGVGLGDLDQNFENQFTKQNQPLFAKQHYNPHNQFLQLALELGIPALLLFLIILFLILKKAVKTRDFLLFILLTNFIFNCLFESMLQRQYGLVFYVFMFCVLYLQTQTKSSHD